MKVSLVAALSPPQYSHLGLDRTKGTHPCDAGLLRGSYDESCVTNKQIATTGVDGEDCNHCRRLL